MKHQAALRAVCRWILVIGLAAVLFAQGSAQRDFAAQLTAEPAPGQNKNDPLVELNNKFRAAYAQARKDLLAKQGPVIIADGDSLILLRGGKRSEVSVSAMADIVKPIAHTPLAIHALLVLAGDGELSEERMKDLRSLRDLIEPAEKSLASRGLPDDVQMLQTHILTESAKFLDALLAAKKIKAEARVAFTRKLGPLLSTSAAYAAATLLDATHKQVMTWKADMGAEEWKQLRVLIPGSAAPRKDNLRIQYFARLLGEKGEGDRIIYAEALFDESRALNRLGSYQLDTVIGDDFFEDATYMHRDLLADGAAAHIKKMRFE
jgi:hypothetical protein